MTTTNAQRTNNVLREIDALNAQDPRREEVDGQQRPRELVYAERMSACLSQMYPGASDLLAIAARGQHVRRWDIPRNTFPLGRDGYNQWRNACRVHHAAIVVDIMNRHGFDAAETAHVGSVIRKEGLKRDPDAQALENVAAVVFVQFYLKDFADDHKGYDQEKFVAILRKTGRKMDAHGLSFLDSLALSGDVRLLLTLARQ